MKVRLILMIGLAFLVLGCAKAGGTEETGAVVAQKGKKVMPSPEKLRKATFAGGCFWCTEAVFEEVKGVYGVASGYIGGQVENPSYKAVCSGTTGHAEAVEILFHPEEVSFLELLEIHFKTHDPTTLNRQGADRGTQYRSAVFFHDQQQEKETREIIEALTKDKVYPDPIVTEVAAASTFYVAEPGHQDYYATNPNAGYCQLVITPKMGKFRKVFADKLRESGSK